MYASSVLARAKAALQGSETEQRIAVLLYDDAVQVVSSFELNQLASLTYHETTVLTSSKQDWTDILLDHLEQIQSQPVSYSVATVQKSLAVTHHVLRHGPERVVPRVQQQLGRAIAALCQYNTVLAAQQQQSSGSWLLRLKGGSVDTAGPVRDAAGRVHALLSGPPLLLQRERNAAADPTSLVPVGSRAEIAFCADPVRWARLQQTLRDQQQTASRSNLAKASDGFGSGYVTANGKTVVGAAHGIEEMLRRQEKEDQKFTDAATAAASKNSAVDQFSEYQAPDLYASSTQQQQQLEQLQYQLHQQQQLYASGEPDLLAFDDNLGIPSVMSPSATPLHATADLLDFGGSPSYSQPPPQQQQQQQNYAPQDLLFGASTLPPPPTAESCTATTTHDPFHHPAVAHHPSRFAVSNLLGDLSLGINNSNGSTAAAIVTPRAPASIANQSTILPSGDDRFAALDALVGGGGGGSTLSLAAPGHAAASSFAGLDSFTAAAATTPAAAAAASFTALSDLSGLTRTHTPAATPTLSTMYEQQDQPPSSLAFALPVSLSSIKVSPLMGSGSESSGSGFLMGGSSGAGLEPLGQAPAAPPPPPGSFY